MSLDDLYKEVILDHYKNPRNKRGLGDGAISCHLNNPLCGDEITIHARLDDGRLAEIAFEGTGCSISQASASMLTEAVSGKAVDEAQAVAAGFRGMMEGAVEPDEEVLGDLVALQGVAKYPVRIKCAVLAWDVLQEALTEADGSASAAAAH
jgi:nitrogen fixation protein NifU and related proteins